MGLLDTIAEILSPTRCAGCELPGELLCARCTASARRFVVAESCPSCGTPFGAIVCTECWERAFAFEATLVLGELAAPLSRAVVLHKDSGERRLGQALGSLLGEQVRATWGEWASAVTWVPPTPEALSRRGFDHGRSLAEPVAAVLGVDALALLARGDARDQRALGRTERAANAAESFKVVAEVPAKVLVVDDVFTTGATLDTASTLLLDAGANAVRAAVVARSW